MAPPFGGNRLGFSNAVRMQPGPSGGARAGPSAPVRGRDDLLDAGGGIPTVEGNGLGYMGAVDRCDSVRDFDAPAHKPPAPRNVAAPEASTPRRQPQMYVAPPRAIHMAMPQRPNSGSQRWGVRPVSNNNPFKHGSVRPGSAGSARPWSASNAPANTGVAGAMHHSQKKAVAPEHSMVTSFFLFFPLDAGPRKALTP